MSGILQRVDARELRLEVVLPVEPSCRSPVQIPRQAGVPVQPLASGCRAGENRQARVRHATVWPQSRTEVSVTAADSKYPPPGS